MATIKTQDLTGAPLDWAVAEAVGFKVETDEIGSGNDMVWLLDSPVEWNPSEEWSQCGLLIQRKGVWLSDDATDEPQGPWIASVGGGYMQYGSTPLVSACRAIVAAKLGDEIDVPDEILKFTAD